MEDRQLHTGANASQQQAIAHDTGPAVVLAGPGSGKTFVIVERVRCLIERQGVAPSQILTITFTRQAAAQMRRRFLARTDSRYPETVFGTFHSVFCRILQQSRGQSPDLAPSILTEPEKRRVMSLLLTDLRAAHSEVVCTDELAAAYLAEIGRLKCLGRGAEEAGESLPHRALFPAVFAGYARMLKELNRIDFDDVIAQTHALFRDNAEICAFWRARFRYLQIDEYQDVNPAQFAAVKLLAAPENNLFAVGDDDQSIYGFRGSDPSLMLNFQKEFPGAAAYELQINYRCRPAILLSSARVIGENRNRFAKRTRAGRDEENGEVQLLPFADREAERAAAVDFLRERGELFTDTAVIVRTNAQASAWRQALLAAKVPCEVPAGGERNFYEEREVADVLAYLRLSGKAPSQADFYRVMNRPLRYLSRECMRSEIFSFAEVYRYYAGRPAMLRTARKFERELALLAGMRPSLAIRFLRTQIGYDRFLQAEGGNETHQTALARLDRLQREAEGFSQTQAFLRETERRREAFSEAGARRQAERAPGVRILTMHAAKGLEFDAVWLPELNEGVLPARRIVLPEQIEEERRLFYVGMTRAKRTLILSYLTGGEHYACAPSRFLRPLLTALVKQ